MHCLNTFRNTVGLRNCLKLNLSLFNILSDGIKQGWRAFGTERLWPAHSIALLEFQLIEPGMLFGEHKTPRVLSVLTDWQKPHFETPD